MRVFGLFSNNLSLGVCALFLGGCDAYKALSLPPTVLDGLRHHTIQGPQYMPRDLLLNVNIHRISLESQLSA